jgi:hypothetical protein
MLSCRAGRVHSFGLGLATVRRALRAAVSGFDTYELLVVMPLTMSSFPRVSPNLYGVSLPFSWR